MESGTDVTRVVVLQRRREANGVVSLILANKDARQLPAFTPGAHVDLHLPSGLIRQYSICSNPVDRSAYRIAVLLAPNSRGGAREVHALAVGQDLLVSVPRNHFPLITGAGPATLLGGGIGVTPLLPMAHALAASSVPFRLHYLTRSRAQTPFRSELMASVFASSVAFHHSDCGRLSRDQLAVLMGTPSRDGQLYVCGPRSLLDAALQVAQDLGWEGAQVHFERFSPAAELHVGAPVRLELARSGRNVEVAGNQSLAEALLQAGVRVPLSCEQGLCGTCVVRVLKGDLDHRDSYLTEAEKLRGDRIALCCSRALTSALTLDL